MDGIYFDSGVVEQSTGYSDGFFFSWNGFMWAIVVFAIFMFIGWVLPKIGKLIDTIGSKPKYKFDPNTEYSDDDFDGETLAWLEELENEGRGRQGELKRRKEEAKD